MTHAARRSLYLIIERAIKLIGSPGCVYLRFSSVISAPEIHGIDPVGSIISRSLNNQPKIEYILPPECWILYPYSEEVLIERKHMGRIFYALRIYDAGKRSFGQSAISRNALQHWAVFLIPIADGIS